MPLLSSVNPFDLIKFERATRVDSEEYFIDADRPAKS